MKNKHIWLGLAIEGILLSLLAYDTITFEYIAVPANYDGDSYLDLGKSIFWHQWISHCRHHDLNTLGKLIWGPSAIICGLLFSKYLRENPEKSKSMLALMTLLYSALLGITYIGYEWRSPTKLLNMTNVLYTLEDALFSYFPYVITFVSISLKQGNMVGSKLIDITFSIVVPIAIFISLIHMFFFGLIICA